MQEIRIRHRCLIVDRGILKVYGLRIPTQPRFVLGRQEPHDV
jgi:hypothetical protein